MIRERVLDPKAGRDGGFRWRSTEVSRVEGLSDAVFGFAVTLLVVSLEVPRTFAELHRAMTGALAFAVSFVLLTLLWYRHYIFFRRYGLEDTTTCVLNAALLFVVLLYVYPLKFLTTTLLAAFTDPSRLMVPGPNGALVPVIRTSEWPQLMAIYGGGFVAVYLLFGLMHVHAWRRRDALELSPTERADTVFSVIEDAIFVGVALLSLLLLRLPSGRAGLAGLAYMLIAPAQTIRGMVRGRALRKVAATGTGPGDRPWPGHAPAGPRPSP